jgi:hypothetical protein
MPIWRRRAPNLRNQSEVALALAEKGWVPYRIRFEPQEDLWVANVIDGGKPLDEHPCRSVGAPHIPRAYPCCSNATECQNRANFQLSAGRTRARACSRPLSVSSTQASNEHSPTSASRAQQVHELRPLGLGCGVCCHRRRRAPGPIGNWSREHNVYARDRLSCCSGVPSAVRGHLGDRIGGLGRVQR